MIQGLSVTSTGDTQKDREIERDNLLTVERDGPSEKMRKAKINAWSSTSTAVYK